MSLEFGITFFLLAGLAICARYFVPTVYIYFKPLPLLMLIGLVVQNNVNESMLPILIALVLGLVGDICLALPRLFIGGLASFLVGHLAYIHAFWHHPFDMPIWWIVIFIGAALLYAANIMGAARDIGKRKYVIPIAIYSAVITLMVLTAFSYGMIMAQALIIFGALLFYLSDSILAWDRFYRPFPGGSFFILATYYGAQFFLATGALKVWAPGA